ncbi:MAG: universal stress protein [Desulfarculus sp.]|jgi:nucleotide-binding universal stress UspA family protein|nr:MAG: universal stress protein [Desulfarculus sp.]
MQINKILWPTDLSAAATAALPYVTDLSQKYGAQVLLLYVADDMRRYDHIYGDAGKHLAGLQEMECQRAGELLQRVCREKLGGCPAFIHHVVKGDPATEILKLASAEKADLIVMASHSHPADSGEYKFFGSVTEKVVKNSATPVLVVNPALAKG